MLKLCFLNAQSLRNKSTHFVCYASSIGVNVFAATETWFSEFDDAHRAEATPPGFKLIANNCKVLCSRLIRTRFHFLFGLLGANNACTDNVHNS